MSDTYQSLSHARWHGTYHVVFVPKRRRKTLYGTMRKALGAIFPARARQKACRILAGHVMLDPVPIGIEIPPKHAVASVSGFRQGTSAIAIARQLNGRERNCTGDHCWARGYAVSTVGCEREHVRAYSRDQEAADAAGRFESTTQGVRSTIFEAALLIKPPALPGVSDSVARTSSHIATMPVWIYYHPSGPSNGFLLSLSPRAAHTVCRVTTRH